MFAECTNLYFIGNIYDSYKNNYSDRLKELTAYIVEEDIGEI